ncbi:Vacuolar calcium ion transporter [Cytospora mali]|uniref:Vacuolar calcium ion transporter n=1 Tax=Cytospora mali TaxID=578113 RepID=A0A194UME0_CYTMA|nr:Vacuolar calcium ion transporter [Valsa mali var. pyri (nom. inval.)]
MPGIQNLGPMPRLCNLSRPQHRWRSGLAASQSVLISVVRQVGSLLLGSWVNLLLVCVPVGIVLNYRPGPPLATFIVNFVAAVGLLGLGDAALEIITSKVGTFHGSLLYISTSNLMQMISSIVLLVQYRIDLLEVSLVGSLLANILLLPALSILYASFRRKRMAHNYNVTRAYIFMLLLAIGAFIIPTVFDRSAGLPTASTAAISRAVSILLMLTYGAYLYFQLLLVSGWVASAIFITTTVLLYFCVDFVVGSLQGIEDPELRFGMFTGFILIPVLNCDVAAIEQAGRSMDLMLIFTIGKCVQSALLVAPLLVVIAWGLGSDDLNLSFDLWMIADLFMSVLFLNTLSALRSFNW